MSLSLGSRRILPITMAPEGDRPIPVLSIVIVNWNTGGLLRECLRSIEAAGTDGFQWGNVVVVDNSSQDGSARGLDCPGLPLKLIYNSRNLGFAAACNQGASETSAAYLLFLNPDTKIPKGTLSRVIAFMEDAAHRDIGVCGVQLRCESGAISRSCARFPNWQHFTWAATGLDRLLPARFPGIHLRDWAHNESRMVDHVMGAFYLVRSGLFRQLAGFDERFFVYLEDLDLSLRVRQSGQRVWYLSDCYAQHKGGGSSEAVLPVRLYYSLMSRIAYAKKHFQLPAALWVSALTLVVEPLIRLLRACITFSPSRFHETVGAYARLWADCFRRAFLNEIPNRSYTGGSGQSPQSKFRDL